MKTITLESLSGKRIKEARPLNDAELYYEGGATGGFLLDLGKDGAIVIAQKDGGTEARWMTVDVEAVIFTGGQ